MRVQSRRSVPLRRAGDEGAWHHDATTGHKGGVRDQGGEGAGRDGTRGVAAELPAWGDATAAASDLHLEVTVLVKQQIAGLEISVAHVGRVHVPGKKKAQETTKFPSTTGHAARQRQGDTEGGLRTARRGMISHFVPRRI